VRFLTFVMVACAEPQLRQIVLIGEQPKANGPGSQQDFPPQHRIFRTQELGCDVD
jgi:hypothetical protein